MAERHAVSRLREGDVSGLEVLVRDYQGAALRAAFLVTQDAAFAEDVVASAFLKACDRIDQFDVRRSFGLWFLRIVVNDAKNAVASRSREVSADAIQAPDDRSIADTLADTGPVSRSLPSGRRRATRSARPSPNSRPSSGRQWCCTTTSGSVRQK